MRRSQQKHGPGAQPAGKKGVPSTDRAALSGRFGWSHACSYLLAVTLISYYPALRQGMTFLPADLVLLMAPWSRHVAELAPGWTAVARPVWDPIYVFYPARMFLASAIHNGFIPWHDPYLYSGAPFIADGQSAFFYPINWFFALLPLPSAFGIVAALHTFLAGLFFTLFMRRRGCGWEAALVGATSWMLCGVLVSWQMWQVVDATLCWLPLCLYFADIVCAPPAPPSGWGSGIGLGFAGLCAALGMMLLAGHEQFALYGVLVLTAYMLAIGGRSIAERMGLLIGALGISGLVAAVQVLPMLELLHNSLRGKSSLSELLNTAMPPNQLAMLLMPEIFGGVRDWLTHQYIGAVNYYELTCYVGAASAVFAVFAFYKPNAERRRDLRLWSVVGLFGLLIGCGTPLYDALYSAGPLVKSFHGLGRTLMLVDLAVAVLASYGVQTALESMDDIPRHKFFGWSAFGMGLLVIALYGIAASRTSQTVSMVLTHDWLGYGLIQVTRALITIALAWIAGAVLSKRLSWLMVVVCAADMLIFASGLNPGADASLLYPKLPATVAMAGAAGAGRVVCLGGSRPMDRLIPNSAESLGLHDVSGSDPLLLANYDSFIRQLNTVTDGSAAPAGQGIVAVGGSPALNYLNVTAVISPDPIAINNYTPVYSGPDVYIYSNALAKGEAWLEAPGLTADTDSVFSLLHGYAPSALSDSDYVQRVDQRAEEITATLCAGREQTVVFSEIADPCWKASVDGVPAQWSTVHGLLIGVDVAPGEHRVSLRYLPQSGRIGLFLTGMGWLIIAWVVAAQCADGRWKISSS